MLGKGLKAYSTNKEDEEEKINKNNIEKIKSSIANIV